MPPFTLAKTRSRGSGIQEARRGGETGDESARGGSACSAEMLDSGVGGRGGDLAAAQKTLLCGCGSTER